MQIEDLIDPRMIDRILGGNLPEEGSDEANQRELARERVREIASNLRATFSTPAGKASLEWMRSITIEQTAFVPGIQFANSDGLSAEQNGFMREGQNSIYREIVRYMNYREPANDDS